MNTIRSIKSCTLYGILDLGYLAAEKAPGVLVEMLEGGVDIVQLRAKRESVSQIAMLAKALLPIAAERGIPFVLNDYPALAGECGLDGAHVGQDDESVSQARTLAGGLDKLIGKSTHSVAQAISAAAEGADYIGFGPLFATPTKPDYTPIGTAEITEVHSLVDIPIFCIGGIKRENLEAVLEAGARRVVIVSGILQAADVRAYCKDTKARLVANFNKTS